MKPKRTRVNLYVFMLTDVSGFEKREAAESV